VIARHLSVDLTEGGRLMHETGAVVSGDVIGQHDVTGVDAFGQRHVSERAFVVHAGEVTPLHGGRRRRVLAEDGLDEIFGDDHALHDGVGDRWVDGDGDVGQERPRGRRPHREIGGPKSPPCASASVMRSRTNALSSTSFV